MMKGLLPVLALLPLLAGCKGKGATGGCDVIGDCGGDPTGEWQVTSVCSFPVVARPAQNYANTTPYYQPETGAAAPAVTSGAWCWDLSFDKDGHLVTPGVPMPNPDVVSSGTVTFNADHTYTYVLTAASTTPIHIARSCFGVNGANLTCPQLAMKMLESGIGVNPVYMNTSGGARPAFACHDAGDGCDCTFDYVETEQNSVGDKGTWAVEGHVIHHFSIAGQGNLFETSPSRRTRRDADFCVSDNGQTLELTGANGSAIALKAGTRSLTLTRVIPDAGTDTGAGTSGTGGGGGGAGGEAGGSGGAGGAGGNDGAVSTTDADTDAG